MRCLLRCVIPGLLALLLCPAPAQAGEAFEWPGGARAAVNLAYDDALASQLDTAIPALEAHGFRGSFYLTLASETVSGRLDEWRAAAARGHELGNHTLYHPCSSSKPGREWVEARHDLDRMSKDDLLAEIRLANAMLYAIDGETARTFTAPCGDLYVGGDYYLDDIRGDFIAAKARLDGVEADMASVDPWRVSVDVPVDASGAELIAVVKSAAEQGTMAHFTFHGIGGDYLSVSEEAHTALLDHLAAHPEIYWVDTFRAIMSHVKEKQP